MYISAHECLHVLLLCRKEDKEFALLNVESSAVWSIYLSIVSEQQVTLKVQATTILIIVREQTADISMITHICNYHINLSDTDLPSTKYHCVWQFLYTNFSRLSVDTARLRTIDHTQS